MIRFRTQGLRATICIADSFFGSFVPDKAPALSLVSHSKRILNIRSGQSLKLSVVMYGVSVSEPKAGAPVLYTRYNILNNLTVRD